MIVPFDQSYKSCEISYCNRYFGEIYGADSSSLIGQNINILMPSPLAQNHELFIKRFVSEGIPHKIG